MINDILNFFDDVFNGSNSRFEKGCKFLNQKQFSEASEIFTQIIAKHPNAGLKLSETKFDIALLTLIAQKNETSAYKQFEEIISIKDSIPLNFDKKQFDSIISKCKNELGKIEFKNAVISERDKKFSNSISQYKKAIDYFSAGKGNEYYFKALTRLEISKLKEGKSPDTSNLEVLQKQTTPFQQDLFYRYTLFLLKNNEVIKAENVLSKHIDFNSKEIEDLKEICKNHYKVAAQKLVNEINNSVEQLYQKEFPINETKKLFEDMNTHIPIIKKTSPSTAKKIEELKPSLFNKLLSKYFSNNQFEDALKHITSYPNFHQQPELIKNVGIAALRLADGNQITKSNYSTVISSWLTSIYSDRAILKSLEQTTWDDEFTFTLCESIGTNFRIDFDVANVNYDEVSPTNISIGATQRELLQAFENILQANMPDQQLSNEAQEFYNKEKDAIEKIIQIIPTDITFATPHFAKQNNLSQAILAELEEIYNSEDNEEALQVGVLYAEKNAPSIITEYKNAIGIVSDILEAINIEKKTELSNLTSKSNKTLIAKFSTISEEIESKLLSAFADKINDDDENEKIIPLMINCINFSPQDSNLREQFSKYVTNLCVSKVNDDSLNNLEAMKYMFQAIKATSRSQRTANNLGTLIKFNLMDILNDRATRTNDIYKVIDDIKALNYETVKTSCRELCETRTEILEQLGTETASTIRLGINLNDKGRALKKVLDYMQELGGCGTGDSDILSLFRNLR